jgi:hypothetical protein|uniref:Uncharacterized protein n=1 Tax=viral metagenome TaxID=1070528 RepID=A0A6C0DLU3_9ZZZZ
MNIVENSNDIIDRILKTAFPELNYSVHNNALSTLPNFNTIYHNFKVVEYKSKQIVIEVKKFNGFNDTDVFMCWITDLNGMNKMAYGTTESIRLIFETLTS